MNWRKDKHATWRLLATILTVALFFTAPVSHAATHPCSAEPHASVAEEGHQLPLAKIAFDDKACCISICASCVTVAREDGGRTTQPLSLSRIDHLPRPFAGVEPSPALEPPRTPA